MPAVPAHPHLAGRGARLLPALREVGPAVAGLAGILAATVIADVWASRTARPTISALIADVSRHPLGGPVVVGVLAGLVHHLAVDPVIRRLEA